MNQCELSITRFSVFLHNLGGGWQDPTLAKHIPHAKVAQGEDLSKAPLQPEYMLYISIHLLKDEAIIFSAYPPRNGPGGKNGDI